jgi:aspartate aminotransferase
MKYIENSPMMATFIIGWDVPGLEEHAIMIDSVSKDTACAVQKLDVLSLKTKKWWSSNEICASKNNPPLNKLQVSGIRHSTSYFDEVISEYRERRDTLVTELNKIEGVVVSNQRCVLLYAHRLKMLMILRNGY